MRMICSTLLTFLLAVGFVSAQLVTFEKGSGRMSEHRVPVEFALLDDATEASTAFESLGITICPGPGHVPVVRIFIIGVGFTFLQPRLVNESASDNSPATPITFHSRYPLRRVGLGLTNNFGSTATITARRFDGTLVGSVETEFDKNEVFVGIESVDPEGFSSFSIDYGESPNEEQLTLLVIDPVEPLHFAQYIPQVAGGSFGDTSITTTISIVGLVRDSEDRDLEIGNRGEGILKFFDSEGEPMTVRPEGMSGSAFPFSLNPDDGFLRDWTIGESGQPRLGYAVVESSLPVIVQTVYTTTQNGSAFDAGIEATQAQPFSAAPVQLHLEKNENVGIALVNTEKRTQRFWVITGFGIRSVTLEPREHRTLFLSDLYTSLPMGRVSTVISIRPIDGIPSSHSPGVRVVATILKTRNGVAVASLPLGSTQR